MSFVRFTSSTGGDPNEEFLTLVRRDTTATSEGMMLAAEHQIQRIKDRTGNGQDVDGRQFAPYSPKYAAKREAMGLSSTPPDLRVSGNLLDTLEAQVFSETSFGVVMAENVAVSGLAINNGGGTQPQRRFFDTSDSDLRNIADEVQR